MSNEPVAVQEPYFLTANCLIETDCAACQAAFSGAVAFRKQANGTGVGLWTCKSCGQSNTTQIDAKMYRDAETGRNRRVGCSCCMLCACCAAIIGGAFGAQEATELATQ